MSGAPVFRQELCQRLEQNADKILLRVLVSGGTPPVELTGGDLLHLAPDLASQYCSQNPGSVVLLLLPHSVELFLLQIGLVLTGHIPAVLAWPTTRIDPEKYQRNLLHQLRNLPAQQLITLPRLAANLGPGLPYQVVACHVENTKRWEDAFSIPLSLNEPIEARALGSDGELTEALFLQFSGGTTGAQKAVVINSTILSAQLERLRDSLSLTQEDSIVSWLPMYHDMGLIACLWLPLWHGSASTQLAASDWLLNPGLLFELIDRYQGTFCWLPNFAFSYLAAQRDRITGRYSLHSMRAWINCSEPVRLRSFREFANCFSCWGVTMESLQASYAMAENVFAITQTELQQPAVTVPRSAVSDAAARVQLAFDLIDDVYVSSGTPLAGMKVRITSNDHVCASGEPGEIQLFTESLFSGYWGPQGYVTNAFTADHWYATGDYGFLVDEELFVIGRLKDIIIIGGQNIFPEDVEVLVNSVPAIYPGRVVAFGIMDEQTGTESLVVVAEMRGEYDCVHAQSLGRDIHKLVLTTIGIAPRRVAVVPERWIVKSTAGKISRRETRDRFVRELLQRTQHTGA